MWFLINNFISPRKFFQLSQQVLPWVTAAFVVTFTYGLVAGLAFAPADYLQGDGFRIIYVHAPSAFLSLFIYAIMSGAAIIGLIWQVKLAFSVLRHSATLGAGFAFLALLTGSLWGKPMWGTWWIWDARLTSELILFFIYISVLFLQSATAHKRMGERITAIFVLVGCIDLPIIHYSVYWWNTLHQGSTLKLFAPSTIDPAMRYPLVAMILAFLFYYVMVLFLKLNHELSYLLRKNNEHTV